MGYVNVFGWFAAGDFGCVGIEVELTPVERKLGFCIFGEG